MWPFTWCINQYHNVSLGPHGGWIGSYISLWIFLRKDNDYITTFNEDDLIFNLHWEHTIHGFSLDKRIFRFFKGYL
jgi:hypothetical protein